MTSGLLLTNATAVDTHTGKLLPGMSVAIEGGKITNILPTRMLYAASSAQRIDMTGKFVVPGYWEMHAHPLDSPDSEDSLTLMLANGITGFRQMSGSDALLLKRRDGKLMPANDVPELLAMPGSVLLRGNAGTIPMVIAEVDKQTREGADFIKTIDVTLPVFFAALDEATKQGLIYDGHIPPGADIVKASDAGMRAVEHLGPTEMVLIRCSTDEEAIRQDMVARLAAAAARPPRRRHRHRSPKPLQRTPTLRVKTLIQPHSAGCSTSVTRSAKRNAARWPRRLPPITPGRYPP